jgi:hypothetical protein
MVLTRLGRPDLIWGIPLRSTPTFRPAFRLLERFVARPVAQQIGGLMTVRVGLLGTLPALSGIWIIIMIYGAGFLFGA